MEAPPLLALALGAATGVTQTASAQQMRSAMDRIVARLGPPFRFSVPRMLNAATTPSAMLGFVLLVRIKAIMLVCPTRTALTTKSARVRSVCPVDTLRGSQPTEHKRTWLHPNLGSSAR